MVFIDDMENNFIIGLNLNDIIKKEKQFREKVRKRQEYFEKHKTNKKKLIAILDEYFKFRGNKPKVLVLCHGKTYPKQFPYALTIDNNPDVKPDILMDIWDKKSVDLFPKECFDIVIMEHCSLYRNINISNGSVKSINIIDEGKELWLNCKKLLKKNGYLRNNYMISLYYRKKYANMSKQTTFNELSTTQKEKIINEVKRDLKKIGFTNVSYVPKYKNKYQVIIKI